MCFEKNRRSDTGTHLSMSRKDNSDLKISTKIVQVCASRSAVVWAVICTRTYLATDIMTLSPLTSRSTLMLQFATTKVPTYLSGRRIEESRIFTVCLLFHNFLQPHTLKYLDKNSLSHAMFRQYFRHVPYLAYQNLYNRIHIIVNIIRLSMYVFFSDT